VKLTADILCDVVIWCHVHWCKITSTSDECTASVTRIKPVHQRSITMQMTFLYTHCSEDLKSSMFLILLQLTATSVITFWAGWGWNYWYSSC